MRFKWLLSELGVFFAFSALTKPQQIFNAEATETLAEIGEGKPIQTNAIPELLLT